MYEFSEETTINADLAAVWATTIDVANWPTWDPHELDARLDGPFEVNTKGWSKPRGGPATEWMLTEVVPKQRWASQCPLPGGKIVGINMFEEVEPGRIRCIKTVQVSGPLSLLFRLYFGRKMRGDMHKTWAALEGEAARRATSADIA